MRRAVFVFAGALALSCTSCSTGGSGSGGACVGSNAVDLTGDNPFIITIPRPSFPGGASVFQPNCLKVSSSSAIAIANVDSTAHTFTIPSTEVDIPLPGGRTFHGESAGLVPGTYDFVCTLHPSMTGTVIVL